MNTDNPNFLPALAEMYSPYYDVKFADETMAGQWL
jgi:hypothetical protein